MSLQLVVSASFPGYSQGQIITDPGQVASVLGGPYADHVLRVVPTTGGANGGYGLSGVPTVVQVGMAIGGSYTAGALGSYVCVRSSGTDQLPRTALPALLGTLPTLYATSVGPSTLALYQTATGGLPVFETPVITVVSASTPGIVLPANALLIGTDGSGNPVPITLGSGLSFANGVLTATGAGSPGTPLAFFDGTAASFSDGTPILFSA